MGAGRGAEVEGEMNGLPNNRDAQRVLSLVAEIGGVEPWMLREMYRSEKAVKMRQVAAYLLNNDLGYSTPEVARLLGWKSHNSVRLGVKNARRGDSDVVVRTIDRVRAELSAKRGMSR